MASLSSSLPCDLLFTPRTRPEDDRKRDLVGSWWYGLEAKRRDSRWHVFSERNQLPSRGGTLVVVQICRSEGFGGSKDVTAKSFTSAELCDDHQSASSRWQLVFVSENMPPRIRQTGKRKSKDAMDESKKKRKSHIIPEESQMERHIPLWTSSTTSW